jgi:hypothetical protein
MDIKSNVAAILYMAVSQSHEDIKQAESEIVAYERIQGFHSTLLVKYSFAL